MGFAVNVNGIEKAIEKNGVYPAEKQIDALVYAEDGFEVDALRVAQELRDQGLIVEIALLDDPESVREYAKNKKIARVVVIDSESGEVKE